MSGSTTQSADSGRWSFEPAHDAPMTAQRPPALWRTMQVAASTSAEARSSSCWIARLCAGLRRHLPAGSRTELKAAILFGGCGGAGLHAGDRQDAPSDDPSRQACAGWTVRLTTFTPRRSRPPWWNSSRLDRLHAALVVLSY